MPFPWTMELTALISYLALKLFPASVQVAPWKLDLHDGLNGLNAKGFGFGCSVGLVRLGRLMTARNKLASPVWADLQTFTIRQLLGST